MSDDVNNNCNDCDVDTFEIEEYYMVWDSVWVEMSKDIELTSDVEVGGIRLKEPYQDFPDERMLCIGCLEKRLGRKLAPDDFPSGIIINKMCKYEDGSDRIKDRMMTPEELERVDNLTLD